MVALAETETSVTVDLHVLLARAKDGDRQAMDDLIERYEPLIAARTRGYFARGLERDDMIQEGRIAFWSAVRNYKPDAGLSFPLFAKLCVENRAKTAITMARRVKHRAVSMADSFEDRVNDNQTVFDILTNDRAPDPEYVLFERYDYLETVEALADMLTDMERYVLESRFSGIPYADIATSIGRTEKAVDNALTRVKRKLRRYLARRQAEEAV